MKTLFSMLAMAALPLMAADISGTWKLTGEIAGNEINRVCTLKQAETRLTGTCKNDMGTVELTGEVKGKDVGWQYEVDYGGTKVTLVYKGTVDGTSMKGSVEASGTTGTFAAQKQ